MPVFRLLFFRDVKNKLRKNFVLPVLSDNEKCLLTQISYDLDKKYLSFGMLKKIEIVCYHFSRNKIVRQSEGIFEDLNPQSRSQSPMIRIFHSGLDQKSRIRGV